MGSVVLSDFDGTIVSIDTAEFVLAKFAQGDWKLVEEQFESWKITFEECMRRQFSMIKILERIILQELDQIASPRPHFEELVHYCSARRFPVIVVSGGLDFWIRHFLEQRGLLELVEVHAPKAKCTSDGITLTFPKLLDEKSSNFKDDLVRYYKRQGSKVLYIGNGLADYPAAKNADFSFAIRGSKLAQHCKKGRVPHKEINDFREVIEVIEDDS